MILFGIPSFVNRFFRPVLRGVSRPIRNALPAMVMALLLAPHRRCMKTLSHSVLGNRVHAATISRRLLNPYWRTRDWYKTLADETFGFYNLWERKQTRGGKKRHWTLILDLTHKGTKSKDMENLVDVSSLDRRRQPNLPRGKRHVFLFGIVITALGGRIPLPRPI